MGATIISLPLAIAPWSMVSPAICTNIAVGVLTVTGDGAYNGTYGIDGTVGGDGDLSFNTTTNTITIVGSIDCTSVFGPACTSLGKVLVPTGTTLLSGVDGTTGGAFSSLIVVAGPTTGAVSFTDTDSKSEALLTALGLGALEVGCSSNLCPGWDLTGFSLGTQDTGSKYTAYQLRCTGHLYGARADFGPAPRHSPVRCDGLDSPARQESVTRPFIDRPLPEEA